MEEKLLLEIHLYNSHIIIIPTYATINSNASVDLSTWSSAYSTGTPRAVGRSSPFKQFADKLSLPPRCFINWSIPLTSGKRGPRSSERVSRRSIEACCVFSELCQLRSGEADGGEKNRGYARTKRSLAVHVGVVARC